jgi:glycosyltransferase involved in cell wall biosynthesis
MSNSLLEAMSMGLASVCTAVDGTLDMVTDGKEGLLFPPDQAQALAEKLKFVMENTEMTANLGREAKQRALEFSTIRMVRALEEAYLKL